MLPNGIGDLPPLHIDFFFQRWGLISCLDQELYSELPDRALLESRWPQIPWVDCKGKVSHRKTLIAIACWPFLIKHILECIFMPQDQMAYYGNCSAMVGLDWRFMSALYIIMLVLITGTITVFQYADSNRAQVYQDECGIRWPARLSWFRVFQTLKRRRFDQSLTSQCNLTEDNHRRFLIWSYFYTAMVKVAAIVLGPNYTLFYIGLCRKFMPTRDILIFALPWSIIYNVAYLVWIFTFYGGFMAFLLLCIYYQMRLSQINRTVKMAIHGLRYGSSLTSEVRSSTASPERPRPIESLRDIMDLCSVIDQKLTEFGHVCHELSIMDRFWRWIIFVKLATMIPMECVCLYLLIFGDLPPFQTYCMSIGVFWMLNMLSVYMLSAAFVHSQLRQGTVSLNGLMAAPNITLPLELRKRVRRTLGFMMNDPDHGAHFIGFTCGNFFLLKRRTFKKVQPLSRLLCYIVPAVDFHYKQP